MTLAEKPGVVITLMGYLQCIHRQELWKKLKKEFAGLGYGALKEAVGTAVVDTLTPFQDRYNRIMADKPYIEKVLKDGAEKSIYAAQRTLNKVYKKVGFVLPK